MSIENRESKKKHARRSDRAKLSVHAQRLERSRRKPVEPATPLYIDWDEVDDFAEALRLHMRRHAESAEELWRSIVNDGEDFDPSTIGGWRRGRAAPRTARNLRILHRIEDRYRLPRGYFAAKLPNPARSATFGAAPRLSNAERRRLAWRLPFDFETRTRAEQDEILEWVQRVAVSGAPNIAAIKPAP